MLNYRLYATDCIREDFQAKNNIHAVYLATKEHPKNLIAVYKVLKCGTAVLVFEPSE